MEREKPKKRTREEKEIDLRSVTRMEKKSDGRGAYERECGWP